MKGMLDQKNVCNIVIITQLQKHGYTRQ